MIDSPRPLEPHTGLMRFPAILLAALAVSLAGCGGGQGGPAGNAEAGLPKVTVDRVAGGKLDLSTLTPGERPLLVWAWSPI